MSEKKLPVIPEDRQSQLKLLIASGKEQGYLTYAEVNDHLPTDIVDPEQIEDIVNTINDMGITVYEKAPDAESLLLTDAAAPDEEAVDEAAAALAIVDAEFGRTTDPVRMYMREMGTVELLTREGEIRIAKRIEEGLDQVRSALAYYPPTYDYLLARLRAGQGAARAASRTSSSASSTRTRRTRSRSRTTRRRSCARRSPSSTTTRAEDARGEEEAIDTGRIPRRRRAASARSQRLHNQIGKGLATARGARDRRSCARARASPSSSWS